MHKGLGLSHELRNYSNNSVSASFLVERMKLDYNIMVDVNGLANNPEEWRIDHLNSEISLQNHLDFLVDRLRLQPQH